MHNKISYRLLLCVVFLILLSFPYSTFAAQRQFERGGVLTGVEHETIYNRFGSSTTKEHQTDFYLKLRQDTVNFGQILAEVVYSMREVDWAPSAWSGYVATREFPIGLTTSMDVYLGDHYTNFRTIPNFFVNYYLPFFYSRGITSKIQGDRWKLNYFWGFVTRRGGFGGRSYVRTDQHVYGLNFGMDLPRKSFVGVGYLGTKNGQDFQGNEVSKSNHIILADARLGIIDDFNIQAEYLHSFYDGISEGKISDYSLVVGPSWEKDNHSVHANFRRLGKDFHYVSVYTPTITNQTGVYVTGRLNAREEHNVYLYGTGNFYWDEPSEGSGRERLYTLTNTLGASIYPRRGLYISANFNITKRNADGDINPVDDLRFIPSIGTQFSIGHKLRPYFRFRYTENRVNHPMNNISREPDGIAGIRWHINRRLRMNFEGEVKKTWNTLNTTDQLYSRGALFLYWNPLTVINVSPSVEYARTDDSIRKGVTNSVITSINYSHQFRKGWSLNTFIKWTQNFGLNDSQFLDGRVRVEKRFFWGKPVMRYGIPRTGVRRVAGDIEGYVFIDENSDGVRQPWEKGMANMIIILDGLSYAITDAQGMYRFKTVLIGERTAQLSAAEVEMKYMPETFRKTVEVRLRQTTQADFPVRVME